MKGAGGHGRRGHSPVRGDPPRSTPRPRQIMVRRSFMTINVGHVIARGEYGGDEDIDDPQVFMRGYFAFLRQLNWEALGFTGVALALSIVTGKH